MIGKLDLECQDTWTETDLSAGHGDRRRIELFDGSLLISPRPGGMHRHIARRLADLLEVPSRAAGLEVVEAVDVRLRADRVVIADVLVTPDLDREFFEASEVVLVAEVVSHDKAVTDPTPKRQLYAEAGIPAYLLVEPREGDEITAAWYTLHGRRYRLSRTAPAGRPLRTSEPVKLDLDPAELIRR